MVYRYHTQQWTKMPTFAGVNYDPPSPSNVRRCRHNWIEGWKRPVCDAPRYKSNQRIQPHSPMFSYSVVSISSDDVSAILDDSAGFYRAHLVNNTVLLNALKYCPFE